MNANASPREFLPPKGIHKPKQGGSPALWLNVLILLFLLIVRVTEARLLDRTNLHLFSCLVIPLIFLFPAAIAYRYHTLNEDGFHIPAGSIRISQIPSILYATMVVITGFTLLDILTGGFGEWYTGYSAYGTLVVNGDRTFGNLIYTIVIFGLLTSVCEEWFYRGILFGALRKYGMLSAVVATGLLYGMAQGNIRHLLAFTFVGMALCVMGYATDTIWMPILVHVIYNGFLVLVLPSFSTFYATTSFRGLFVMIAAVLLLLFVILYCGEIKKRIPRSLNASAGESGKSPGRPAQQILNLFWSPATVLCVILYVLLIIFR